MGWLSPDNFPANNQTWLRLVRNGNNFLGYRSQNGVNWQFVMYTNVSMNDCIEFGLVTTNFSANGTATVEFDNVFFYSTPVSNLVDPNAPSNVDIANEFKEGLINVYPNPTNGKIRIEMYSEFDERVDIQIFNTLGQPVRSLAINSKEDFREEVDLGDLPNGVYNIHFKKADGTTEIERILLRANR